MENTKKMLADYAKEVGVETLFLETLINSHRFLRVEIMKTREEQNIEFESIRKVIEKQARESITHGEYISIQQLKKMNIIDISDLIQDYNERHK